MDVELTAGDGNRLTAYLARPEGSTGPRVVVLPDAHGLNAFYREMANRFAEAGMTSLAIDFYGRTAGSGPRDAAFDIEPHLEELRRENMIRDVRAAVAYLEADGAGPVFVAGFCMGGGTALLAGTTDMGLAGVIGFYAWTGELGRDEALPDDFVAGIRCPVLGLFGGADQVISEAVPRSFTDHLQRAGVPHEIVIYPSQPHGFFELRDMGVDGREDAAADAWRRLLDFVRA